jgi:RNase P/RNase MRP subunit p29
VDGNGIVQSGKETKQSIQLVVTKDQLDVLKKARVFKYKVRVDGNDINSNIHFIKSNTFDLKAGLFVKGDVSTTLGTKTQQ